MKLFGNRKGAEHIAARKTEKKTGGLKRWQRVTIIVAAIVLVLGGTALAVYKVNVKPPVKQPEPVETEPLPEEETVKKPTVYVPATEVDEETGEETEVETEVPASHRAGVYNILIAGTDGDGYRTDTIIVAHLDENTHEVALMSVPRDTAVMNGNGGLMKINSVYANGKEEGMERLERRLSSLLGFEMDGYVLVNLDAFVKVVDLVGGVTVNVPQDMYYSDPSQDLLIDLKAGEQKLDGKQAMGLVRFRKGYASQDIQRTKVQQEFLKALAKQCLSLENLTAAKLKEYAEIFEENVVTDLSVGNMLYFAQQLMKCDFDAMKTYTIEGEGAMINGVSYYPLYASSIVKIVNESFNPYDVDLTVANVNVVTPEVARTYQKPAEPVTPTEPEQPDETEDPENPGNPENPDETQTPETPETPENPDGTETPENPDETNPEQPETPETPEQSGPDDTIGTDFWN